MLDSTGFRETRALNRDCGVLHFLVSNYKVSSEYLLNRSLAFIVSVCVYHVLCMLVLVVGEGN